jgi:hypothetical protein
MCDSGLTPETLTVPALLPNARPRTSDTSSKTGRAVGRSGDPSPISAEGRGRGTARDTSAEPVRGTPFSNGTDFAAWSDRNCWECARNIADPADAVPEPGNCPLYEALADAYVGDGEILVSLARRYGGTYDGEGGVDLPRDCRHWVPKGTEPPPLDSDDPAQLVLAIDPALLATPSTCSTPAACLAVGQCAGRCWRVGEAT